VDLAASQSGSVFVCDAISPGYLHLLAPDGTLSFDPFDNPGVRLASIVYDDVQGVIYAADYDSDNVLIIWPLAFASEELIWGFSDLGWGCLEIDVENRILWVADSGYNRVYEFCLPGYVQPTVEASYTCVPSTGTLPFTTQMTVTLNNVYTGQIRRLSGRIDISLAGGGYFPNWRAGFTNITAGGSYTTAWNQNIPALGSLEGENIFVLHVEDVTPAPYNQPPYPPSGDTDTATCTVTGIAP
jgi:hypothetical protein